MQNFKYKAHSTHTNTVHERGVTASLPNRLFREKCNTIPRFN